MAKLARTIGISRIGAEFGNSTQANIIYRVTTRPEGATKYPYLVVSHLEKGGNFSADLVQVRDPRFRDRQLRKKARSGLGIEVSIYPLRKMNSYAVAKWFSDVKELYSFCKSSGCQLVLVSEATSIYEMISGACFDSILKNCCIDPKRYWQELQSWLDLKLQNRVYL
jgi:hypothetical protein